MGPTDEREVSFTQPKGPSGFDSYSVTIKQESIRYYAFLLAPDDLDLLPKVGRAMRKR